MSVVDLKKKMITSLARIVYSELVQQHHSCFALTGLDHVTVMITQDKSKNHPFFLKQIFTFFIVNSRHRFGKRHHYLSSSLWGNASSEQYDSP